MKKTLKTLLIATLAFVTSGISAQSLDELTSRSLSPFNKIIVSPRVSVILIKGNEESVKILYNDIPENKVNVVVKGNKLRIFLDHARVTEKQVKYWNGHAGKHGLYTGSSITAYVTFKELKAIEIRGEGEVRCDSALEAEKFKIKAYGENEIRLASLRTTRFKASLYGENDLKIMSGATDHQVYRLFGENKIDTRGFKSEVAATRIYGEGKISVSASDVVRVNAFGEPTINVEGTSFVSRGIIVGRAAIYVNR